MNLFKKAALFTDIHFGEKIDAEIHNQDCIDFIEWFIDNTKNQKCDTIIFVGDYFHNRVRTENRTGDYAMRGIEMLNAAGIPILWIVGNHDLYYSNNRDIYSLNYIKNCKNIELINEITVIDDVILSPWLINDEHQTLLAKKGKYLFGHLELPFFLMNKSIEKKNDGGLLADDFQNCDAVYSGHFHKKQVKVNCHDIPVHFIGNCFGHNFNDVDDNERGMSILKWGEKSPTMIPWDDAPTYNRNNVSAILEMIDQDKISYNKKSVLEITNDLFLDDSDLQDIKNILDVRTITFKKTPKSLIETANINPTIYKSLDHLVIDKLEHMNYDGNYDNKLLIELYNMV